MFRLLLLNFIVVCGFAVQGFTGFGAALFLMPLLAFWLPLKEAVPLLGILSVVNGGLLLWRARAGVEWLEWRGLLLGALPGLVLGVLLLTNAPDHGLRRLLGAPILLLAVWFWCGTPVPKRSFPRTAGGFAGLLGGPLGGLFGISGPPPICYLAGRGLARDAFRATMLAFILSMDVLRSGGYAWNGLLTAGVWWSGASLVPASLVGGWFGERLQKHASEKLFRQSVGGLMALMGALLLSGR